MKKHIFLCIALLLAGIATTSAQAGEEKTSGLIKSKKFTFYATAAQPQNSAELSRAMRNWPGATGTYINLEHGYYDLVVKPDSVIAFLPFYGRNFSPNYDRDDQGFDFTSTDFSYTEKPGKKGGWTITIKPKDAKNNQQLLLSITSTGYATLSITNTNRSYISYNGYVDESKVPKKKKDTGA